MLNGYKQNRKTDNIKWILKSQVIGNNDIQKIYKTDLKINIFFTALIAVLESLQLIIMNEQVVT